MFGLLDLLALAAVVVAALGIVNTLSMDTWERVRELGMLRAAGMSRRQVWRSVLVEAGILGLIGAIVGSRRRDRRRASCWSRRPVGGSTAALVLPIGTIVARAGRGRRARDAGRGAARADRGPALDRGGRPGRVTASSPCRAAGRAWSGPWRVGRLPRNAGPRDPAPEEAMSYAIPRMTRVPATEKGLTIADFLIPIGVGSGSRRGCATSSSSSPARSLIYLTAPIAIPIPGNPVPFTLQTFGVLVVGGALGLKRGGRATLLYVALGVVGLPFFAEGKGGIAGDLGTTGGYLIGFVLAAALVGRLAELGWDRRLGGALGATALGTAVIYLIGVPWLAVVPGVSLVRGDRSSGCCRSSSFDIVKLVAAAAVFPAAWWVVGRRPSDR